MQIMTLKILVFSFLFLFPDSFSMDYKNVQKRISENSLLLPIFANKFNREFIFTESGGNFFIQDPLTKQNQSPGSMEKDEKETERALKNYPAKKSGPEEEIKTKISGDAEIQAGNKGQRGGRVDEKATGEESKTAESSSPLTIDFQEGYEPVSMPFGKTRQTSINAVIAAYMSVWLICMGYLVIIRSRQKKILKEIRSIQRRISEE